MASTSDLLRRMAAIESTRARFAGKPFAWGRVDCVAMAHWHLARLGHAVPPLPAYRSLKGALGALRKAGADSLPALLDTIVEPIGHARMLPGDLLAMRGEGGLHGLLICVGSKAIGFHEDAEGLVNVVPIEIERAWRV